MRIGIDGTLLHGRYSGVEYSIHHLLHALARCDAENEFVVYVPAGFQPDGDFPPSFTWHYTSFPGRRRLRRIFWQQCQLPRQLVRDGVDIHHGPGYIIPLRCPVPAVVTVYDIIALTHPRLCRLANFLHYRWALPRVLRRAARVIVPSESVKDDIVRLFPETAPRLRVVPLGIDEVYFHPIKDETAKRVRAKFALPERYILFIGNLEKKKNLRMLIEVFGDLKARHAIPHHLVLAGCLRTATADLHHAIQNVSDNNSIHLLDYVPQEDLPALYRAAEVFVLPSLVEGFGLPVLEAMALGTPVVASNRGALPEVVADAGLLCDPEDPQSLREALLRLINDQHLRLRLSEAGNKRAQEFTWKKTAEQVISIYREVYIEHCATKEECRTGA